MPGEERPGRTGWSLVAHGGAVMHRVAELKILRMSLIIKTMSATFFRANLRRNRDFSRLLVIAALFRRSAFGFGLGFLLFYVACADDGASGPGDSGSTTLIEERLLRVASVWSGQGDRRLDLCLSAPQATFRTPRLSSNGFQALALHSGRGRVPVDLDASVTELRVRWVPEGGDCGTPAQGTTDETLQLPVAPRLSLILASPGLADPNPRSFLIEDPLEMAPNPDRFYVRLFHAARLGPATVGLDCLFTAFSFTEPGSLASNVVGMTPYFSAAENTDETPYRFPLSICSNDDVLEQRSLGRFSAELLGGDLQLAILAGGRDDESDPLFLLACSDQPQGQCRRIELAATASMSALPERVAELPQSELSFGIALEPGPATGGTRVYVRADAPGAFQQLDWVNRSVLGNADELRLDADGSGFSLMMRSRTATVTVPSLDDGRPEEARTITFGLVRYEFVPWGREGLPEPAGSYIPTERSQSIPILFTDTID